MHTALCSENMRPPIDCKRPTLGSALSHSTRVSVITFLSQTLQWPFFNMFFICLHLYAVYLTDFSLLFFVFLIVKNCDTFWLPNLTKDMESFSKFYGIAFSQEEREVAWIIIKGLLARSLDSS